MFRVCHQDSPLRGKITTFIWVASAAVAPLGCMDDTVRIAYDDPNQGRIGGDTGESAVTGGKDEASTIGTTVTGVTPTAVSNDAVSAPPAKSATAVAKPGSEEALPAEGCWQLPVVDRARLLAPAGLAAALAGGKIVGSNESATNGFVDIGVVSEAPADEAWIELDLANTTPYRFVKYYGPGGSFGALAELELYAGEQRLDGQAFGSAGSRDEAGTVFANALDGDAATWFEGPSPNDNYVGLDLGAGHELPPPSFNPAPGAATPGDLVSIGGAEGATLLVTTDGSDPLVNGVPYAGPIALGDGSTLIKAVATGSCGLPSSIGQAVYSTALPSDPGAPRPTPSGVSSSMHIGNSLTDTINDYLPTVAASGGIALEYNRYSIPGAGTWMYNENPTGGFGVENVQEALRTRPFDHISMQPYSNWPCQPVPSSDGDDSDSGYLEMAWADAMTQNPNVQLWVYQQWPAPTEFNNCITGGVWTRADWQPPEPASWEDAVANELVYQETVRNALVALHPEAPPPFIVPGGLALVALKGAVEAGQVPGISDFFGTFFQAGGTDIHMTPAGAYFITLVFYGSMFQQTPEGLANESGGGLTDEQAAVLQRIAWQTLEAYPLSGVTR
jgi:hypothetical protein